MGAGDRDEDKQEEKKPFSNEGMINRIEKIEN